MLDVTNLEARGSRSKTAVPGLLVLTIGIGLVIAGAVAVFVSTNASGTAALLATGAVLIFAIMFRDRIQKAKIGSFEFELAVQVKDQLRTALDLKMNGNYEGSELEIQQAFDRFVGELSAKQYYDYSMSTHYQQSVYEKLRGIVSRRFSGEVQYTSGTGSFFPLVDAMLILDGHRVGKALEDSGLTVCPDLRAHLEEADGKLRVGVTIRPGPQLDPMMLVDRLKSNVKYGALSATCFLLIQNCKSADSGREFRDFAHSREMHATSARWLAEGTEPDLDNAITEAILTVCSDLLPHEVRLGD